MEQISEPYIPDHPLRGHVVGRWFDRGMLAYHIGISDKGQIRFLDIDFNGWRVVINQVRWEGDVLCFDQYHFGPKPHPFDGVRNAVRIEMGASEDELWLETDAEAIRKSARGVLTRGS